MSISESLRRFRTHPEHRATNRSSAVMVVPGVWHTGLTCLEKISPAGRMRLIKYIICPRSKNKMQMARPLYSGGSSLWFCLIEDLWYFDYFPNRQLQPLMFKSTSSQVTMHLSYLFERVTQNTLFATRNPQLFLYAINIPQQNKLVIWSGCKQCYLNFSATGFVS